MGTCNQKNLFTKNVALAKVVMFGVHSLYRRINSGGAVRLWKNDMCILAQKTAYMYHIKWFKPLAPHKLLMGIPSPIHMQNLSRFYRAVPEIVVFSSTFVLVLSLTIFLPRRGPTHLGPVRTRENSTHPPRAKIGTVAAAHVRSSVWVKRGCEAAELRVTCRWLLQCTCMLLCITRIAR